MKLAKKILLLLFVFSIIKIVADNKQNIGQAYRNYRHRKEPVSLQQKSQHMITFLDAEGERTSLCTGTAIGPHALLTASHCNEGEGPDHHDTVTLDLSTQHFHLLAEAEDGRDHVIYLLDGPAFTNFLPESALLNVVPPKKGETVYLCGDGLGAYPPYCRWGVPNDGDNDSDVSDIDKAQGMQYFTLAIIPGDSGSAVFGSDGRVVAIITYGGDAEDRETPSQAAAGFGLNFKKSVLDRAATFSIEKIEAEDLKAKIAEARSK
jgi:hypothetical protein